MNTISYKLLEYGGNLDIFFSHADVGGCMFEPNISIYTPALSNNQEDEWGGQKKPVATGPDEGYSRHHYFQSF
ncbi:hypothetical protein JCM14469_34400 [Desulfatiferula olefinivorans]